MLGKVLDGWKGHYYEKLFLDLDPPANVEQNGEVAGLAEGQTVLSAAAWRRNSQGKGSD